MDDKQIAIQSKTVSARELYPELKAVSLFAHIKEQDLDCIGDVEVVQVPAHAFVTKQGDPGISFWILLSGEIRAQKVESDGSQMLVNTCKAGDTFGEVPILLGYTAVSVNGEATTDSRLVRISTEGFWRLMASCPVVRTGVLANMARRLEAYTVQTMHREKLISLGTLAAGLMHELNNPGAAARRAASHLRENLNRLQHISLRFTQINFTAEQLECMRELQDQVLAFEKPQAMSTLEQSDAEEALLEWLESIGVENAWKLAPTLVAVGWGRCDIECAQDAFPPEQLSNVLNWLEALISSMQQVGTIEESLTRVTDLVVAVKKYAYNDRTKQQKIDVHDSIQSTLVILGHKFRHKQLTVEKQFAAELPLIAGGGGGLNQAWTNILDNAIDAAPEQGKISIHTWVEGSAVCVGIVDNGPGIPREHWDRIFEPFFTTKPVGVGTGLGLDIAHRIVVGQYSGEITFTSEPGRTEFIVRLPIGE